MNLKDLNLLWQIELHCERCMRACAYFLAVRGSNCSNLWSFTQNCYAEAAIIHWCNIFGSHSSEPTHFKFFFEDKCTLQLHKKSEKNEVKSLRRPVDCGYKEIV